jgi:hypothetical protein
MASRKTSAKRKAARRRAHSQQAIKVASVTDAPQQPDCDRITSQEAAEEAVTLGVTPGQKLPRLHEALGVSPLSTARLRVRDLEGVEKAAAVCLTGFCVGGLLANSTWGLAMVAAAVFVAAVTSADESKDMTRRALASCAMLLLGFVMVKSAGDLDMPANWAGVTFTLALCATAGLGLRTGGDLLRRVAKMRAGTNVSLALLGLGLGASFLGAVILVAGCVFAIAVAPSL